MIWDERAADLQVKRGAALDARGRDEEAICAYRTALELAPKHPVALVALATLLGKRGDKNSAHQLLEQAVAAHPRLASAHVNLAALLSDADIVTARHHYETALQIEPHNRAAHRGLAIVLLRLGEKAAAQMHGRSGFGDQAEAWPFRGEGQPLSVLVVFSALGGNLPIHGLLDDRRFQKWTLLAEFFPSDGALPPHDVAINGIGDADLCTPALVEAGAILARSMAPRVNDPARVLPTTRALQAQALAKIPGVHTALTRELPRTTLLAADAAELLAREGFTWPLLIRAPGFHTGQHFAKSEHPADLAATVADIPGEQLLVLQFLDTRDADGNFRKYRVMFIDGQLYPLHLAISARWKVHFLSADMADHAEHRAEDAAFLQNMPEILGPAVMATLDRIAGALRLDYSGIDFAVDAERNVVVFEANATMIILPPGPDERWRYRVEPVERARRAFQRMLLAKAGRDETPV